MRSSNNLDAAIPLASRSNVCCQFLIQSQLIIIKFTRLEQTTNLHSTLALLILGVLEFKFPLFGVKLGIVAGELLEGDQEVAEDELEAVLVRVGGEETVDEV
jgi:hypothetical protein